MKPLRSILAVFAVVSLACCATQSNSGQKEVAAYDPGAVRREFLTMLARPRVALEPETSAPATVQGNVQIRFSYAAQAGQRVPGVLVKPIEGTGAPAVRRAVVIAMHGTGGNKNDQLPFLRECVARGFIGVAIDGRYHGERAQGMARLEGMNAYETAIVRAYCDTPRQMTSVFGQDAPRVEEPYYPLYYDTVWDILRLVDYLRTREDVDPARIGIYGVSKGGIEAYLAGAADPRLAVVVPAIGVQTFHWGLVKNAWQGRVATVQKSFDRAAAATGIDKPDATFVEIFYNRVMPGIHTEFDGPGVLPLIAPRPLLMINSDNDGNTPIGGVMLAAQAARDAYAEAQPPVPEHFLQRIQPGAGHRVTRESEAAAVEWFVRWLKP